MLFVRQVILLIICFLKFVYDLQWLYNHARYRIMAIANSTNLTMIWILLLSCCANIVLASASDLACCSQLRQNSECYQACIQFGESHNRIEQLQLLASMIDTCPRDLSSFWTCVNQSATVFGDLSVWPGRLCCHSARTSTCLKACHQATSVEHIKGICPQSNEVNLYRCVNRQQVGMDCCRQSETLACRVACYAFYLNDGTSRRHRRQFMNEHCTGTSRTVARCVSNQTRTPSSTNLAEYLPCCRHAEAGQCRDTCNQLMKSKASEKKIINELIKSCGDPLPTLPLWQCLIPNSGPSKIGRDGKRRSRIDKIGVNGAKLQCCSKAATQGCNNLCYKTFSSQWSKFSQNFYDQCVSYQLMEKPLQTCLVDVEAPCELGCSGMEFCENFNYRPTEMFRSCSLEGDQAAKMYYKQLQNGMIRLPQLTLPVKDIMTCEPKMWKAIACSLAICPCRAGSSAVTICRGDCLFILKKCLDEKRLEIHQSVENLCKILSPKLQQSSCVSISQYIGPSVHKGRELEVTNPCASKPCADDHICMVNRRKCKHAENCKPYVCRPGCQMGESTSFLVPRHSYVRIMLSGNEARCHQACRCSHRGLITHCTPLPCEAVTGCASKPGYLMEHSRLDCNYCVCFQGENICTHRNCPQSTTSATENEVYTGIPCGCSSSYTPVCGNNSKTYPSECVARCNGIIEVQTGRCESHDPCQRNPCRLGYKCVARRQVCLNINLPCTQYECVAVYQACNPHHHDPVCSTDNNEFNNMCLLLQHSKTLAHWGHCLSHCKHEGTVCAVNGHTYNSECSAWTDGATVDYDGECKSVGKLTESSFVNPVCDSIQCPKLTSTFCTGITPPGACCPLCGGEIRILWSRTRAEQASAAMNIGPITVQNITEKLSDLISIAECRLSNYLSIEGDLVILVTSVMKSPSELQVKACLAESHKIAQMVTSQTPIVMSHLTLSPLLTAELRNSEMRDVRKGPVSASIFYTMHKSLVTSCLLLLILLSISFIDW